MTRLCKKGPKGDSKWPEDSQMSTVDVDRRHFVRIVVTKIKIWLGDPERHCCYEFSNETPSLINHISD